ncbi:MAG: 3-methyladenine glycosylase [Candidatus Parcubacteria bacterium]|nr:3-methyladenine glycosylase [Candidatus Parcubacteria bacterium]
MKPLPLSFFKRPTLAVAKDLIGCRLVRRRGDGTIERHMITETEAYDGHDDLASHASKGRTPRTDIMFGPGGYWYVYLIYGMYWMLNVVTGPKDYPAAVLIRGLEGISGPGRLTKALGISHAQNKKPVSKKSDLWIEGPMKKIPPGMIEKTARIGIDYAGPLWTEKEYRFVLKSSKLG